MSTPNSVYVSMHEQVSYYSMFPIRIPFKRNCSNGGRSWKKSCPQSSANPKASMRPLSFNRFVRSFLFPLMRTVTLSLAFMALTQCKPGATQEPVALEIELSEMPVFQRDYWPTDGWRKKELPGADRWKDLEDYAFSRQGTEEERAGIRTDSVVIIKDGYLVYERYAAGYTEKMPHLTWSVSKSVLQALVGRAVQQGLMELDDPIEKYIPEGKKEKTITIRHLLHMSSGLDANEGYESGPLTSTVIAMLYTRGRDDMARFCASLPTRAEPGAMVYYSSCDTNIVSGALKEALIARNGKEAGEEAYARYPWTELFEPLGMDTAVWERDASGTFVGSSYLYASPRDMARFAFLFLNDGVWEGKRLLPENWLEFTRKVAPAYSTTSPYPGWDAGYTSHWYSNSGVPGRDLKPACPSAPEDTFAASGHWGQMIFVIPSLDLIIVRMGDDRDYSFDKDVFLKKVLEALELR